MLKIPKFIAEDKILKWLLVSIFVPLVYVFLSILFTFLGIKTPSVLGSIFNYLGYLFILSFFSLIIYVPFLKKTANVKTKEAKILITFWILISLVAIIVWVRLASFQLSDWGSSYENLIYLLVPIGGVSFIAGIPFLILHFIIGKVSIQKRQVIIFSTGSFIIASLITATLVYTFKPNKTAIQIYPWDLKDSTRFNCSVRMGATMFPKQNYEKHTMETIDGAIFTNDPTKMALEIEDKTLKMLVSTSYGPSGIEPAKLVILKNSDSELLAVDTDSDALFDNGLDTFVMNKKNGTAVWTRARPSFFTDLLANAQAYYMECR